MKVPELGSVLEQSCSSGPVFNCCTRLGDVSYQLGNAGQVTFLFRASVSLNGKVEGITVKHFIDNFPVFPQSSSLR